LDPKFFTQVRHCFGKSILVLHIDQQFLDPEDLKLVDALRNYKETSWAPGLPHGGLSERNFIFPDFKDLDRIVKNWLKNPQK
jgi:hypothetical protein